MQVIESRFLGDGFPVIDARFTNFDINTKLSLDSLGIDLQMQLTHTTHYYLLGLLVYGHCEGGVLALELGDSFVELRGGLSFGGTDGEAHHGGWHVHTLSAHQIGHVALGQTFPRGTFEAEDGENVTCFDLADFFHFVGMHFDHSAHFQFLTQFVIPHIVTFFQLALIDSDIGQLAISRLFEFENIPDKWFCIRSLEYYFFFILGTIFLFFCDEAVVLLLWR
jgi:hypothetical protein